MTLEQAGHTSVSKIIAVITEWIFYEWTNLNEIMPRGCVSYGKVDETSKDVFEASPDISFYMTFVKEQSDEAVLCRKLG
jgi:hypothetical protein